MSWLRSAVSKAVEVGGNNNLTRTVKSYAENVTHAVAEGAKILQDRMVKFPPFRLFIRLFDLFQALWFWGALNFQSLGGFQLEFVIWLKLGLCIWCFCAAFPVWLVGSYWCMVLEAVHVADVYADGSLGDPWFSGIEFHGLDSPVS